MVPAYVGLFVWHSLGRRIALGGLAYGGFGCGAGRARGLRHVTGGE